MKNVDHIHAAGIVGDRYGGTGKFAGSKKKRKREKASSTPGRMKADHCKASPEQKGMAKHGRAYRAHPSEYQTFRRKKNGTKKPWLNDSEWELFNAGVASDQETKVT